MILYFDESRFGTRSKRGRGWFPKGVRTKSKVKLGFDNFYLYTAVNPNTGYHFSYIMPKINTYFLNEFLEALSIDLKGENFLLIMDGAKFHRSKHLVVPSNIKIEILPPYSPELNPVERLWAYIKSKILRNKYYEKLEELEEAADLFLYDLEYKTVKKICQKIEGLYN